MIIKNKVENEATLSNVGQVGEFRIRNSAKAFGILSSGLYANKIRAIVREYSCNAYDSHVEAGKVHCPFDVHLPNSLEPWFAVRDYGVGLNDQQVSDIFTTYFESTKTNTDELIGGLGLGSKSAFSYTDNFTITAIKAGTKRIYTAFINEHGVPSVAMMLEEDTDEATGVEIKFSVNDQYDFCKFREEAEFVYSTFKLKPNVTGVDGFSISEREYLMKDIIPGVHQVNGSWYLRGSTAIMGNISYPIKVPNDTAVLGDLADLLDCNLEIEFDIGTLDIQASREGLSYIPETIEAIREKLELVRDAIVVRIADEADALDNEWLKAMYVVSQAQNKLTSAAATAYANKNTSPLLNNNGRYVRLNEIHIDEDDLVKWNIRLRGFKASKYADIWKSLKPSEYYDNSTGGMKQRWTFPILQNLQVVINPEGKAGSIERAKFHWKTKHAQSDWYVYVADPLDKDVPMDIAAFRDALHDPHNGLVELNDLEARPKIVKGAADKIVPLVKRLERRKNGSYGWGLQAEMVWRAAGKLSDLDSTKTYYYVPMHGHSSELTIDVKCANLVTTLTNTKLAAFSNVIVYGVRKADQAKVAKMANWINLEDFIVKTLESIDDAFIEEVAANELDNARWFKAGDGLINRLDSASPFVLLVNALKGMTKVVCNISSIDRLMRLYKDRLTVNSDFANKVKAKIAEFSSTNDRYPMLAYLQTYIPDEAVAEYINMVDSVKGI